VAAPHFHAAPPAATTRPTPNASAVPGT
jgi:hypothetical protein